MTASSRAILEYELENKKREHDRLGEEIRTLRNRHDKAVAQHNYLGDEISALTTDIQMWGLGDLVVEARPPFRPLADIAAAEKRKAENYGIPTGIVGVYVAGSTLRTDSHTKPLDAIHGPTAEGRG